MKSAAVLTVLRDGETLKKITIDGEAELGRAEGCVIRLEDRAISRHHAVFRPTGDGLAVERRSEFAPLVVNGSECTRAILKEGDVISLGPYLMRLSLQKALEQSALAQQEALEATEQLPAPKAGDGAYVGNPVPAFAEVWSPKPEAAAPAPEFKPDEDAPDALHEFTHAPSSVGSPLTPSLAAMEAAPAPASMPALESESPSLLGIMPPPVGTIGFAPEGEGGAVVPDPGILADGEIALGAPIEQAPVEGLGPFGGANLAEGVVDLGAIPAEVAPGLGVDPADASLSTGEPATKQIEVSESMSSISQGLVDPEGATKLSSGSDLRLRLVFKPGTAPIEEFEVDKPEVSIGRGKECDIVLDDKKVSRKNSIIVQQGPRYVIKDLDSANGTFVNGRQVKEEPLYADDVVRIGNSEFQVHALSENYAKREKDFIAISSPPDVAEIQVPEIALPPPVGAGGFGPGPGQPTQPLQPPQFAAGPIAVPGLPAPGLNPYAPPNPTGIPGVDIAGINGAKPDNSLFGRFRQSTGAKRYMYIALFAALAYFTFFDDDDEQVVVQQTRPAHTQKKNDAKPKDQPAGLKTFEQLPAEKQRFIEAQHNLAFDLYRNKKYAEALYEIEKIFDYVQDYKDSREIERYAKEAKQKIEAMEEEKRKKEEEARTKAKIAELSDQAKKFIDKKQYEQAKEIFMKIIDLDPENQDVAKWRKEIDDALEKQRFASEAREVQKRISVKGWEIYARGVRLKKTGKYHAAIAAFAQALENSGGDRHIEGSARAMIRACRELIAAHRNPLIQQGQEAEQGGNFAQAYQLYHKANEIDPGYPAAVAGMNRVKKVLHERCKGLYTEAVLAESYSDFEVARHKYQEILSIAPTDDIYHDRATRKLSHFFRKEASE